MVVVGGGLALGFLGLGIGRKAAVCVTLAWLTPLPCGTDDSARIRRLDGGSEEPVKGSST